MYSKHKEKLLHMILHETLFSEADLKCELQALLNDSNAWQQVDQNKLIQSMLVHIGSVDSELRDGLIYGCFYTMIVEQDLLHPALLNDTLQYCVTDLLDQGIGESESDSVFTRTFTMLLVALILAKDNESDFIEANKIEELTHKLIAYLLAEKDVRGYVPDNGWAHSVAHVSDVIDELVKSPKFNTASFLDILRPLWQMMLQTNYAFIHDEDERLLVPIFTMLEQGLQEQEIITLLSETTEILSAQKAQLDVWHYRILRFNWKSFLKSFYIQTANSPQYVALHQSIADCLKVDK